MTKIRAIVEEIIIENEVSINEKDNRTWERRIDNCIKSRDDAEDEDIKKIWDRTLKSILKLAKRKTNLIN